MSSLDRESEASAFGTLEAVGRVKWLAQLAAALTVAARDTYEVEGESLRDPSRMRRFNELLHRTLNQLRQHLHGDRGYPDNVFLSMVRQETAALNVVTTLKELMREES